MSVCFAVELKLASRRVLSGTVREGNEGEVQGLPIERRHYFLSALEHHSVLRKPLRCQGRGIQSMTGRELRA